ncbi:Argonaute/Dicer protein, PAZ [Artemisia annua]|uniref:Argonaute/Dicer protein, PAZ n=1 Tax=Artemisia annua TaxID=35608 RepID=A0A2U1LE99_ARTAN|nr:Argonaute/Dicer protein, PAZ [Artemisia annua]
MDAVLVLLMDDRVLSSNSWGFFGGGGAKREKLVKDVCSGLQTKLLPRSILGILLESKYREVKSSIIREVQLLFVILQETKGTYSRIKRVCETGLGIGSHCCNGLGIVSQCCKPQHVMNISNQYLENVALKINVKVGGRNADRPTIIFGGDVTHPQPREYSSPSISADVLKSLNSLLSYMSLLDWPQVTKYKALISAQPHRQEIIQDLYTTRTDPKRGVIHGALIRMEEGFETHWNEMQKKGQYFSKKLTVEVLERLWALEDLHSDDLKESLDEALETMKEKKQTTSRH